MDDALAYVDTPTRRDLESQVGGGTLLYDAIVTSSRDIMQAETNRKAQILLTDGVDTGSETTIGDAQRADTLVYSILFSDPGAYPFSMLGPDGRRVLTRISSLKPSCSSAVMSSACMHDVVGKTAAAPISRSTGACIFA